jgi:prepilin-type N-terminal cleavage/methylation domain-containing protein
MNQAMKGFTLLETLLVLALVALMAVAGIAAYQQRIVNFKVEKTALQMQALLEAAQNYNVNYSAWPSDSTALDPYLGAGVLNNCPWSYSTATCYSFVPQTSSASFGVSITVPSTQPNATQIAQMIATRLPNASASGAVVTARVTALVLPQQPSQGQTLMKIYPFRGDASGAPVSIPLANNCQTGTIQKVYFMLSGATNQAYDQTGGTSYSGVIALTEVYGMQGSTPANPVISPGASVSAYIHEVQAATGLPTYWGQRAQAIAMEVCESSRQQLNSQDNKDKNTTSLLF